MPGTGLAGPMPGCGRLLPVPGRGGYALVRSRPAQPGRFPGAHVKLAPATCVWPADRSFDVAAERLQECCGVTVSGETARRHCTAAGATVAEWGRSDPGAAGPFRAAAGEVEVQVDAGMVNTTGGWRDLKVVGFARRLIGPALPPTGGTAGNSPHQRPVWWCRTSRGSTHSGETGGDRSGVSSGASVSVLGDGADWIWGTAEPQFPGSRQVLDVYHALEYVSDAAKGLYGEGTGRAQASYESDRSKLLPGEWPGVREWVVGELACEDTPVRRTAVEALVG